MRTLYWDMVVIGCSMAYLTASTVMMGVFDVLDEMFCECWFDVVELEMSSSPQEVSNSSLMDSLSESGIRSRLATLWSGKSELLSLDILCVLVVRAVLGVWTWALTLMVFMWDGGDGGDGGLYSLGFLGDGVLMYVMVVYVGSL